jgi:antitoxin component of MazEF toxin-antitoxin module
MPQRHDYEYIDFNEGETKFGVDEFLAIFKGIVEAVEDKDASDIQVSVDGDGDLIIEFDRPETAREAELREEREETNRRHEEERKLSAKERKLEDLRRLAAELGVTVNEQ